MKTKKTEKVATGPAICEFCNEPVDETFSHELAFYRKHLVHQGCLLEYEEENNVNRD